MKKFSKFLVAGMLVASMALFAGCGGGEEAPAEDEGGEEEAVVLTVGTNAEFAPFEYVNEEDGKTIEGFDIDLIKAIAEDQGMEVEIQNMGFDGLVMAVQNGSIDACIAGMSVTPDRLEQVDFTETYFDAGLSIAVPAKGSDIKTEEDLKGKVVAAQIGTTGAAKCTELKEAGIVKDVKILENINVCMMDMKNGSTDAVIMDIPVNAAYAAAHPEEVVIASEFTVPEGEEEQFAIAVKKDNADLLDKLNTGLKNIKENGKYEELIDKYFGAAE